MTERTTIEVVVDAAEDVGERVDVVLGRRVPGLSRRSARAMALEGHLRVDGRRASPSTRVQLGARLELSWVRVASPDLPVVLRVTEHFVYVNKPAGVHTHRLRPSDPPSVADAVALVHPECTTASADARERGAIHRLDGNTTGVVAFARTLQAWETARRGLRERRVDKLYLALCRALGPTLGDPSSFTREVDEPFPGVTLPDSLRPGQPPRPLCVAAPIGRADARTRAGVREDGLQAQTIVWRLDGASGPAERVGCLLRLLTGRRHQARIHLAHVDLPILGDGVYGVPAGAARPLLHALRLDLSSACPGESPVDAPLPPDMLALLER